MNIYTNYNVKNVSTNTNLNKQSSLSKYCYSNNAIQDNVSFKAQKVATEESLGFIKSLFKKITNKKVKNEIFDEEVYNFIKDYNPAQYLEHQLDIYESNPKFQKKVDKMYRGTCGYAYGTRSDIDFYRCNVNKKGSSLQSQVLESYRMNPNALFELLQKKDLYDEPNIKSLYYENLPQLFSIFKETPSIVDDLLCGNITKIMSQRIRPEDNNWSEIIQTLKNAPKALDELLSAADSKTGKTLMHDFGKEQNVNALSTINEIYKDSPEKLKELYSKKDKFEAIRLRTGWSGGDGYYDYKSSEKTPLEYLTPENLVGLREKYPILNDIKL